LVAATLKEKLIKIGAKVVSHNRYIVFQMAEVAIPRQMFQEILRLIEGVRPNATQNGQTNPRTPCRSLLCRKSPLSRAGTSKAVQKIATICPTSEFIRGIPDIIGAAPAYSMVGWFAQARQQCSAPIASARFGSELEECAMSSGDHQSSLLDIALQRAIIHHQAGR